MEKFNTWFVFAVACIIFWGFWGFLPKITIGFINPKSAIIWEVIGAMLVGFLVWASVGFKLETDPKGALLGMLTGMFGLLGAFSFLYAVSKGKVSVIVTMTALYPVLVLTLSYFILHETITIKQGFGVVLAMLAMILFAA